MSLLKIEVEKLPLSQSHLCFRFFCFFTSGYDDDADGDDEKNDDKDKK